MLPQQTGDTNMKQATVKMSRVKEGKRIDTYQTLEEDDSVGVKSLYLEKRLNPKGEQISVTVALPL
jgi:hypothetical protein